MTALAKLPKLQLPSDEVAQRKIAEASALARKGELKAAQQILKEGVATKLFPAPLQRQVMAWWSADQFDLLPAAEGEKPKVVPAETSKPKPSDNSNGEPDLEAEVVRLMRERAWSRKEACQYIDEGGLEMEAYQEEQNRPMNEAFAKLKQQGPPQWFVDAMKANEEKRKAEEGTSAAAGEGGQVSESQPTAAPVSFGPDS
eukprot:TRINITY_DN6202_c0_g5_i1.p1 TRINITY_DN6202_c0_g5~~TRINITY_DN6202_c0_g5_i1.p1  ORF type:complete len:200 (-),score=69.91 TRINITY_DN6202_c0_g5_i1:199-798(-)